MGSYDDFFEPQYVPVEERRQMAARKITKMKKAGKNISPVEITGRSITTTFWGKAWCKNLESYSDYANRLPRGRSYVRNGAVIDLQIEAGRVKATVSGTRSSPYTVTVNIEPLSQEKWQQIKGNCAGQIGSLVELLQGSLSKSVMEIVTRRDEGLFPSPKEIELDCSCPDWATMCKHVAATLYGVGARLDHQPELLFTLRGVDPTEMVEAAISQPTGAGQKRGGPVLAADELSSVFGIEIDAMASSTEDLGHAEGTDEKTDRTVKTRKTAATRTRAKKPPVEKAAKKGTATRATAAKKTAVTRSSQTKTAVHDSTTKKAAPKKEEDR